MYVCICDRLPRSLRTGVLITPSLPECVWRYNLMLLTTCNKLASSFDDSLRCIGVKSGFYFPLTADVDCSCTIEDVTKYNCCYIFYCTVCIECNEIVLEILLQHCRRLLQSPPIHDRLRVCLLPWDLHTDFDLEILI
jgi:hypothetical protein